MAENEGKVESGLETLTEEEVKILAKAIKKVEAEVFYKVLKRFSAWVAVVLSVLLLGGLFNLSSCTSNVENSAAQKLSSDPELREKVVAKAQGQIAGLQEALKKIDKQTAEIEMANARASATFIDDLKQIRLMVSRISSELGRRLPSGANSIAPSAPGDEVQERKLEKEEK